MFFCLLFMINWLHYITQWFFARLDSPNLHEIAQTVPQNGTHTYDMLHYFHAAIFHSIYI